jgi:hypothetical protein
MCRFDEQGRFAKVCILKRFSSSRFVILKAVQRKDVIETLPLPRRLLDYLQTKNFLSELIESDSSSQSQVRQQNGQKSD